MSSLWPVRTLEEQRARLIGEVFGNLRLSYPNLTREQVANRIDIRPPSSGNDIEYLRYVQDKNGPSIMPPRKVA